MKRTICVKVTVEDGHVHAEIHPESLPSIGTAELVEIIRSIPEETKFDIIEFFSNPEKFLYLTGGA